MFTTLSTTRKQRSAIVLALVIVLVGALALGSLAALVGSGGGTSDDGAGGDAGQEQAKEDAVQPLPDDHPVHSLARREADDPLALGDTDAPLVMIEYADFQCAFCGRFARGTEPQLVEEYVETGVLRIEFRNFPIFGPESDAAARASWAAGRQDKFWEFHRAAFAEEFHRDSGRFTKDGLLELATEAGVPDLARFAEEMESEEAGKAVEHDAEEGYQLGVTTTPAFLINGHPVLGAQPVDTFRDTIDQLHAASRS